MGNIFIERAQHARARVLAAKSGKEADKYLTAVRRLPAEIRLVGLGQALAILLSRSDGRKADQDGLRRLYDDIEDWMLDASPNKIREAPQKTPRLLQAIIDGENDRYRLMVAEVDGYLAVLKRLAEIFLSNEGEPDRAGAGAI
jgi:CRISPR type III-B/RAMP module-associated protein Cmr5